MFDKFKINKKYLNIGIITLIIGVILLFVYQVSRHSVDIFLFTKHVFFNFLSVISPIIYAFIISYILYRPLLFIDHHLQKIWYRVTHVKLSYKTCRLISLFVVIILVFGTIALLINSIVPPIIQNLLTVGEGIPNLQTILTNWFSQLSPYFKSIHISESQIQQLTNYITVFLSTSLMKIFASGTGIVTNITSFFINLFATLILTFYFLKDTELILNAIDKLATVILSDSFKQKTKRFLKDLHEVFGGFILGQLLDALIVGIASTILLLIIGHPFALLIGFIAGITNVIPYIGPIIGAVLALILGLFTSVRLGVLGALLLIVYQQIDGNFVQPKILGESVGLAPVWIFMAILIGGNYFGAIGMILAVPIVALLKIYLERRLNKTKQHSSTL